MISSDCSFIAEFTRHRPFLSAWISFAAYSASASILVQFLVLPVLLPGLHAGHGLLLGNDSVGYHALAAGMAEQIRLTGWSAWSLAPQGQAAAGLAAPFYHLIAPSPWSLIPVTAALHATTGVIVMRLISMLDADLKIAFTGAALWVVFPSSLQWVSQIPKDGYFFAGILGALLGLAILLRNVCAKSDAPAIHFGVALLVAGIILAGVVRPYSFLLMQAITAGYALIVIPLAFANTRRKALKAPACATISCCLVGLIAVLGFAPRDTRLEAATPEVASMAEPNVLSDGNQWQSVKVLPAFIDGAFRRLAIARHAYLSSSYKSAGSMIDLETQFHNSIDLLRYLPRAADLGFLAPFPAQWFSPGTSPGGTTMRLVAGIEMLVLYPLLIFGLPLAVWRWHSRPEFWLTTAFCAFFIVLYASVTPNIGSLYRMRYGFLMTLSAIGLAALWTSARDCRAHRGS